jgi:ketosteroid isomerase-like protein
MAGPRKALTAALVASCDDVEAQFYEALQRGDIEMLMAIWSDDDEIYCVHPGGPRLVGPGAIRSAFESIFSNGPVPVTPMHVKRVESAGAIVHNVLERVDIRTDEGQMTTAWVIASNVYLKTAQGWRIVAHHASPATSRDPSDIVADQSTIH